MSVRPPGAEIIRSTQRRAKDDDLGLSAAIRSSPTSTRTPRPFAAALPLSAEQHPIRADPSTYLSQLSSILSELIHQEPIHREPIHQEPIHRAGQRIGHLHRSPKANPSKADPSKADPSRGNPSRGDVRRPQPYLSQLSSILSEPIHEEPIHRGPTLSPTSLS